MRSSRSAFAIPDQRSRFRDAYQALVRPVSPTDTPRVVHADGDDDYVAAAALSANADLSVTGDDSLLGLGNFSGIAIVTPAKVLRMVEAG